MSLHEKEAERIVEWRPGEKITEYIDILEILGHRIRRQIILSLQEHIEMSYSQLLRSLKIDEGLLNFHLRKLGNLLQHTPKGTYILTKQGKLAIQMLHFAQSSFQHEEYVKPVPKLSTGLILRRTGAFFIDALTLFLSTGIFLDTILWGNIQEVFVHLFSVTEVHPWLLHPEHLPMISLLVYRTVAVYAHVFFAAFLLLTLLEAHKGQTPGKYLFGIRVVKVAGGKLDLVESAIRNAGKIFLLPFDLMVGVIFCRKKGFLRFFDLYTEAVVERSLPTLVVKG